MKETQSTLNSWSGDCQSEEMENVTVTKPWKDLISHQLLCWNTHSIKRFGTFLSYMWLLKIRLCVPVFKNLQSCCQQRKKGTGGALSACQIEYFEGIWIFAGHHGLVSNKKRLFIMRFVLRGVWHPIHPTSEVFYSCSETNCGCCWGRRPALLSAGTSVSTSNWENFCILCNIVLQLCSTEWRAVRWRRKLR